MGRTSLLKVTLDAPVVVPARAVPAAPAISKPAVRKRSMESPGPWTLGRRRVGPAPIVCKRGRGCMQGGKKSEVRIQKAEGRNTRETRNSRERGNSCGVLRFHGKHKNISAATF